MQMKKINKVFSILLFLIGCFFVFIFIFLCVNYNNYEIEKSPIEYDLSTRENKEKYFKFLIKKIKPIKLQKFIPYKRIPLYDTYNEKSSGLDVMEVLKYYGYTEVFAKLFNKDISNYDDLPVNNHFIKKFNINPYHYFKMSCNVIIPGIDYYEKKLEITEYQEYDTYDTDEVYYHYFDYILDNEGNIDDIIYDYTS